MERKLLLLTLALALLLVACSISPDYASHDSPTYEPQTEAPDPFYYDEYGARYKLVDGTYDEYCLDKSYEEEIQTPDSTAFTSIGYHPFHKQLWVTFRNSGVSYVYYEVEPEVWNEFKNADSKGGFFHEAIKGYYEYDRE